MMRFGRLRGAARRGRDAAASPVGVDHGSTLPAMRHRPSVKPILSVTDLALASDFYRGLGFDVSAYDEGYAWVNHCGWELFHLRAVPGLESGAGAAYVHVDDADGWHAALAATGGAEIGAVSDMPWGMREFSFADPSGNVIRVGQNL